MRLVFLGDISAGKKNKLKKDFYAFKEADIVFANLEGPIVSEEERETSGGTPFLALHNSEDVLQILRLYNIEAACLANNHIFDFPAPLENTKGLLRNTGIESFGAGTNLMKAGLPLIFSKNNTTVKIFGFGWDVIGCRFATAKSEGVNPFIPQYTLDTIRKLRAVDNSSFVIFIMHWNYELELYPQPAHRQLAHDLIREGVDAVIGLHPHVAQGAELVDGKPIIYSLGNWFFPVRQLGHIRLAFPPIASRELALELDVEGRQVNDVRFYWHQFDADKSNIKFEKTEKWGGSILKKLTPFDGMSHDNYIKWFKKNRVKRRGLPIYKDYHDESINRMKDIFVKSRQRGIELLLRLQLKRGLKR